MSEKANVSRQYKQDVERWIEKNLKRFREHSLLVGGDSLRWHTDPDAFVQWLKERFGGSPVTYRQYRKRFATYAEREGFPDVAEVIRSSSVLEGKGGKGVEDSSEKSKKKLSKAKNAGLSVKRQERLIKLAASGSHGYEASLLGAEEISLFLNTAVEKFRNGKPRYKDGESIAMLVRLSAMTGLRPSEWFGTYLAAEVRTHLREDPYKEVLVVKGALKGQRKNNQNDYRYLSVAHWADSEKALLGKMLQMMELMRDEAEAYLLSLGESNFTNNKQEPSGGVSHRGSSGVIRLSGVMEGVANFGAAVSVAGAGAGANADDAGSDANDDDLHDGRSPAQPNDQFDLYDLGRVIWSKTIRKMTDITSLINLRVFNRKGVLTLYSGRHLYASEFRRAGLGDKIDLAEALGHSNIVNQAYYSDSLSLDDTRVMRWSLAVPLRIERAPIEDRVAKRSQKGKLRIYEYLLLQGKVSNVGAISLIHDLPNSKIVELAQRELSLGVKDGAASALVEERGLSGQGLASAGSGFGFDEGLPVNFDMDM